MLFRLVVMLSLSLLTVASAVAQQPASPFNPQPLPPPSAATPDQPPANQPAPPPAAAPPAIPSPASAVAGRIFCDQDVSAQPANPSSMPEPYRPFAGIFSDADWTPQICAALVVEAVTADGAATITYVFGPMSSGGRGPSGVLHGTGVIKDGALAFQNSDGSQYVFKPFYTDLSGSWTTSKGETYQAIFKRTY